MALQTVSAGIQFLIKQDIGPGVRDALTEIDRTFEQIKNDSISVERDHIGRGWQAVHTFLTSVAGNLKASGPMGGDDFLTDDKPFNVHSTPETFPTVAGGISPGFMQRTIPLQEWMGNMFIPIEFARADMLTASIGSAIAAVVKQTSRMVGQIRANLFFTPDATNRYLAKASASVGGGLGTTTVTYTLNTESQVRCLQPGMVVDITAAAGAPPIKNSGAMIVETVHPFDRTVVLSVADGVSVMTTAAAATDELFLRSSMGNGPAGLYNWMTNTGTVFGVNFATFPQFQTLVYTTADTDLTEFLLKNLLSGYVTTHGSSWAPDTILTTDGVLNEYVYQMDGGAGSADRYQRQGKALSIVGGHESSLPFHHNGRILEMRASDLMPRGRLLAMKLRDHNIKRYVPPRPAGMGTEGQFGNDIEFIAGWGASGKDIWKHAHASSATTKFLEAPFLICEEYCPEAFGGVSMANLNEEITYVSA